MGLDFNWFSESLTKVSVYVMSHSNKKVTDRIVKENKNSVHQSKPNGFLKRIEQVSGK